LVAIGLAALRRVFTAPWAGWFTLLSAIGGAASLTSADGGTSADPGQVDPGGMKVTPGAGAQFRARLLEDLGVGLQRGTQFRPG
jgi:hypothetical protein